MTRESLAAGARSVLRDSSLESAFAKTSRADYLENYGNLSFRFSGAIKRDFLSNF
jgi:hypothetical protein